MDNIDVYFKEVNPSCLFTIFTFINNVDLIKCSVLQPSSSFFLLVIRMVNLLKYIGEKNGTCKSPRYRRGLVVAEFHCINFSVEEKHKINLPMNKKFTQIYIIDWTCSLHTRYELIKFFFSYSSVQVQFDPLGHYLQAQRVDLCNCYDTCNNTTMSEASIYELNMKTLTDIIEELFQKARFVRILLRYFLNFRIIFISSGLLLFPTLCNGKCKLLDS